MVTLEQVEQLDEKVKKAVGLIEALRLENNRLTSENSRLMAEKRTLEAKLEEYNMNTSSLLDAQELLEKGILGAIDQLSSVEDAQTAVVIAATEELKPHQENHTAIMHAADDAGEEDEISLPVADEEEQPAEENNQKPLDIF